MEGQRLGWSLSWGVVGTDSHHPLHCPTPRLGLHPRWVPLAEQGEDQPYRPFRASLSAGPWDCTPPPLWVPALTLNFLYPHFPGNEDDHKVTGKASKLPPELRGRQKGRELYSHGRSNGLGVRGP